MTLATTTQLAFPTIPVAGVRRALLERREIALLDVREEDPFAQVHPLWAANLPLSTLELHAWRRLPRRDVEIVVYGEQDGRDLAPLAAQRLRALGYTRVGLLAGGLAGWQAAGGEVFRDVNVPSKAFGELVESQRHTPSLSAQEVQALLDEQADVVVLDARRFDEYRTMSIPGAVSVPGAELVLRVRDLAPHPATRVIVNCAGRTRSIIGTQSLVNAGIPNPVAALRNGTIGWTLAGQVLDHGASRRAGAASQAAAAAAAADAASVASRAGVHPARWDQLPQLHDPQRTVHLLDVRTPEEYEAGHAPGFASAPGGQLVQETDHVVPVRGARIVLADDDGVRANMTGSWLAQMGWEVHVLAPLAPSLLTEAGPSPMPRPVPPSQPMVSPTELQTWLQHEGTVVLDVAPHAEHVRRHVPGAWFVIRSDLEQALSRLPGATRYVVACAGGALSPWVAQELQRLLGPDGAGRVWVLEGGTGAWERAGLPVEAGATLLASEPIDRYRRPYEGTDAPREAMQAYLDWEFGLVEQLGRDGTHHFKVI
jgi:rhodanese-related sulfurtransferase